MTQTLAEFADRCGVSRAAITQAVRKGNLIKTTDGKIDDANPVNRLYLDGKTGAVKKQVPPGVRATSTPKPKREPKPRRATKPKAKPADEDGIEDDDEPEDLEAMAAVLAAGGDQADLLLRKLKAETELKEAQRSKIELDMLERKKELVKRQQLVDLVNRIQKALSDHIHQQHAKSGPQVFALAQRDGATELEITRRLESDYGGALRRVVEEVTRAN